MNGFGPTLMLTPMETQVLELIVYGHSNAKIAKVLLMQPRTVEHHINKIFLKLSSFDKAMLSPGTNKRARAVYLYWQASNVIADIVTPEKKRARLPDSITEEHIAVQTMILAGALQETPATQRAQVLFTMLLKLLFDEDREAVDSA